MFYFLVAVIVFLVLNFRCNCDEKGSFDPIRALEILAVSILWPLELAIFVLIITGIVLTLLILTREDDSDYAGEEYH